MMDQCAKFASRGISAEFVGEVQTNKGTTPEALIESPRFRNMLRLPTYKENMVALSG